MILFSLKNRKERGETEGDREIDRQRDRGRQIGKHPFKLCLQ